MKAIFHYDAGPRLQTRLDALGEEGFSVASCPEADDLRLTALLPEAEVLLHVLKPGSASIRSTLPLRAHAASPLPICRVPTHRPSPRRRCC
jgi:hypothetical protein